MLDQEHGSVETARGAFGKRRWAALGIGSGLRLCRARSKPARKDDTERHCFDNTIQLRVPGRWTIEAAGLVERRNRYAVCEPDGREIFWLYSLPRRFGGDPRSRGQRLRQAAAALADPRFLAARGWTGTRRATLSSGDLLLSGERCDDGEIRLVQWMRFSLRGDAAIVSNFQLATVIDHAEEAGQRRSLDTFEREIRAAAILMPDR